MILAALVLGLFVAGCTTPAAPPPPPPSIILISIDSLRADRLASYGYTKGSTPNLDRFAADGARFAVAYCDTPRTTPALATVLTGIFANRHALKDYRYRLPESRLTLAEVLSLHGYSTSAAVGSAEADSRYNLDQGFDVYDDLGLDVPVLPQDAPPEAFPVEPDGSRTLSGYRSDRIVTDAAIDLLDSSAKAPFFLWVNYLGPHDRYFLRDGRLSVKGQLDYDTDVTETDRQIGRLLGHLDQLGLAETALVIVHGAHGKAFGEHGASGQGRNLHEESVRVPVLMRFPGRIPAQSVLDPMIRTVDLFPTALDLAGLPIPANLDGRSVRDLIEGKPVAEAPAYLQLEEVVAQPVPMIPNGMYFAASSWYGVRLGPWKYFTAQLHSPCIRNPESYERLKVFESNPTQPVGGERLADERCTKPVRQDLYEAEGTGYLLEDPTRNRVVAASKAREGLSDRIREIRKKTRDGELLPMDERFETKLKNLRILQ